MWHLIIIIWVILGMNVIGAAIAIKWNAASDKRRSDDYYRPRIEAERESKERRRMNEFLGH